MVHIVTTVYSYNTCMSVQQISTIGTIGILLFLEYRSRDTMRIVQSFAVKKVLAYHTILQQYISTMYTYLQSCAQIMRKTINFTGK